MNTRYLLALAVLCALGTVAAQAQPSPFIGTWKLDLAKSKFDPASAKPKASETLNIQAAGGVIRSRLTEQTQREPQRTLNTPSPPWTAKITP